MKRFASVSTPKASHDWHDLIPSPPSAVSTMLAEREAMPAIDRPLATFLPTNYEEGYAYPLVVWLHDAGLNERHLPQVMQHVSTQNFVAIAPRATEPANQDQDSYTWQQNVESIAEADQAVAESIHVAKQRFPP